MLLPRCFDLSSRARFAASCTGSFASPLLAALLTLGAAPVARSQELGFTVVVVDWTAPEKERMRRGYRSEAGEREVLYCVQSWDKRTARDGLDVVVITSIHREDVGRAHKVADVGEKCLAPDGSALPIVHTHADGNCQFSPSDLVTIAARRAPFEGVQCGERHFIWAFAWQITALANSMEARTLARTPQR